MDHTDIPKARPNFARQVEATGLTLLSLALRLNHVTRVTENLRLINTDHLSRVVSLDVDLRNLTVLQREALAVHESPQRPSGADRATWPAGDREPKSPGPAQTWRNGDATLVGASRLWVPISRHSREDLAPVVVKDSVGAVVPRLTQQAATSAVIAGVTRLFRTQLSSQPSSGAANRDREDDHRARWLIENAIARLIEHGIHGKARLPPAPRQDQHEIRRIARDYLLEMAAHQSRHYAELLKAASREYFLIVMLDLAQSHQFLTYEAPLIPAVRSSTARRRAWRALLPFSTEFTVDYVTQIPRSVGSYHVTVDVPEEIDVRRFILSSDAEELVVDDLAGRIDALNDHRSGVARAPSLVAAERRELEAMLGVLGQRRHLDVEGFDYYLQNRDLLNHQPGDRTNLRRDQQGLGVADLRRLQGVHADGSVSQDWATQLDSATLARIGRWLQSSKLGLDVSTDNDPRENGAHAQWRPVPLGFGHPNVEPVEARLFLALADEPPALVESVARMVGALVVVVTGVLLAAAAGSGVWAKGSSSLSISQADAAVAVLLIVPGILLTRLDIQSTHSVLGRLRRFPQTVAYLSVAVTTGLALTVAGASNDAKVLWYAFGICAGLLAFLLILCYLEKFARHVRRGVLVPASATIPVWLGHEFGVGRRAGGSRRTVLPDVYFDAIRPVPNTTRVASRAYEHEAAKREQGRKDRRLGTPEGPTLLADLAARAVSHDDTITEVEVTHSSAHLPHGGLLEADEVLYTAWEGLSFQVSVKSRPEHDLERVQRLALLEATGAGVGGQSAARARWSERSRLLPVSIRGNTLDVDFLAEFGQLASRKKRQQAMLDFMHACLNVASAGIVPTLVNTPAAPTGRDASNQLRLAAGPALRLTFSVPYGKHAERLDFESKVVTIAADQGIPLWRASRRPDAGQGDWEQLNDAPVDAAPQPTDFDENADPNHLDSSTVLVPLTFVGKRGEEGVEAFLKLAKVLKEGEVRLAALTASVLGQHAVVNVLAEGCLTDQAEVTAKSTQGMADALEEMFAWAVVRTRFWDRQEISAGIPFDVCIGVGPGEILPKPDPERDTGFSLWIDWELPMHALAEEELAEMFHSECAVIGPVEIRFWRTRAGSDERVRGRAKLAVHPSTSRTIEDAGFNIGDRAKAVQSQLMRRLRARLPSPAHGLFLHVVWSEPWLTRRRGI